MNNLFYTEFNTYNIIIMFSFINFSSMKNFQECPKSIDDDYVDIDDNDDDYVIIPSYDLIDNMDFGNDCVIITKIYEI